MTDAEKKAALEKIVKDINDVSKYCTAISNAAQSMNKKVVEECYPSVQSIADNWSAGPAMRYMKKTGGVLGDLQDDCASIAAAAALVYKQYVESCRDRIKALGLDPHKTIPELY